MVNREKVGIVVVVLAAVSLLSGCNANVADANIAEFHHTIRLGNLEEVERMLDENPRLANARRFGVGRPPLAVAAYMRHSDIVKMLVIKGAKVNAKYERGDTVLHAVSKWGDMELVKFLIERGANVNAKDDSEMTPLHRAGTPASQVLLEHGANVNAKNDSEMTPLHWAANFSNIDRMQLLINSGANVNAKSTWEETPLHRAVIAKRRNTAAVELLIRSGADVNASCKGRTPLDWAKDSEMANLLRKYGGKSGKE